MGLQRRLDRAALCYHPAPETGQRPLFRGAIHQMGPAKGHPVTSRCREPPSQEEGQKQQAEADPIQDKETGTR